MKNNEKAIIAGVGSILDYFFLKKKQKKMNVPDLSISPSVFYA